MHSYLQAVEDCVDEIDPVSASNTGLSERLLDLEEQWEIGDKSPVADASFRNLMCVVLKLEAFRRESRTFASMALDCYFDICMALPRMVLICSIPDKVSSPAGCRAFALATQFRRCIKTGD